MHTSYKILVKGTGRQNIIKTTILSTSKSHTSYGPRLESVAKAFRADFEAWFGAARISRIQTLGTLESKQACRAARRLAEAEAKAAVVKQDFSTKNLESFDWTTGA